MALARLRFEDYKVKSGDGGNTWTVFIDQVPSIFVFFDCSGWLMDWIHVQRAGGSRKFVERKKSVSAVDWRLQLFISAIPFGLNSCRNEWDRRVN
jgi:hypothetical protein